MKSRRRLFAYLGAALALLFVPYCVYVGATWLGYGRAAGEARDRRRDPLLDRFMPVYEVGERHETRIAAPASDAYAAARALDLQRSVIVRAIFRGRELIMGGKHTDEQAPGAFLEEAQRLGWRVLAEAPGREIVLGAATRPWEANVRFEGIPPGEFSRFDAPRYVKIVWNLAVEPLGPEESIVRTETRVATTDAYARRRFSLYWAALSPGILLIRREALRVVKADAERSFRESAASSSRGGIGERMRPR